MAEETGRVLNGTIRDAVRAGKGIGRGVGEYLAGANTPYASISLLATAAQLAIPVTVHVAIGTDIIHMHPDADGGALGEGSLRDFRYFVSNVARLERGVYLNCGSAVVLPEVFLKAVALARNTGASAWTDSRRSTLISCGCIVPRPTWSPVLSPGLARDIRSSATTRS